MNGRFFIQFKYQTLFWDSLKSANDKILYNFNLRNDFYGFMSRKGEEDIIPSIDKKTFLVFCKALKQEVFHLNISLSVVL